MQSYFYELADHLQSQLQGNEIYTAGFGAEDSSFVRFNHNAVRQAGTVTQRGLGFSLIDGKRQARTSLTLTGTAAEDKARLDRAVGSLRAMLPHLPEDPHMLYSTDVKSSETVAENALPERETPVQNILQAGSGKDLVGIYASGGIYSGFANSLGQRNWFSSYSFNVDWSVYHHEDKAVKSGYAGFAWDENEFGTKMQSANEQLGVLGSAPKTLDPGRYRVYLSPVAIYDILGTVSWGGFGLKDHRTKQTTLLKMVEGDARLNERVNLSENTADGVAPNFQAAGFIKPAGVDLIQKGCFKSCLTSPRSAKEYGVETNAASSWETPESIDMAAGSLARTDVLKELDTGLYINNVWYLNYSDRPNCRMTGMTRFATFWVENGQIAAPVNVMRFDESLYRMLGDQLIDLTAERDFILDSETYGGRSTGSGRVPGALVDEFTLTL